MLVLSKVPVTASAYLYVGKYLDDKISDISSSAGGSNLIVKGLCWQWCYCIKLRQ
jgi:hypothetical protein